MKLYFAVLVLCLSSFCIAETLSNAMDDEADDELIKIVNDALMEEIDEVIFKGNAEDSEEETEYRFDENTIMNFAKKIADLVKTAKKCWEEIKGKKS
uniref:Zodarin 1a n=1 Tax=Zodarion styliferum TaxID=1089303 RepID=A0A8D7ZS79_9ARAC|nr:Zodarin 1a precursor [Zodarion styliferum]